MKENYEKYKENPSNFFVNINAVRYKSIFINQLSLTNNPHALYDIPGHFAEYKLNNEAYLKK